MRKKELLARIEALEKLVVEQASHIARLNEKTVLLTPLGPSQPMQRTWPSSPFPEKWLTPTVTCKDSAL